MTLVNAFVHLFVGEQMLLTEFGKVVFHNPSSAWIEHDRQLTVTASLPWRKMSSYDKKIVAR